MKKGYVGVIGLLALIMASCSGNTSTEETSTEYVAENGSEEETVTNSSETTEEKVKIEIHKYYPTEFYDGLAIASTKDDDYIISETGEVLLAFGHQAEWTLNEYIQSGNTIYNKNLEKIFSTDNISGETGRSVFHGVLDSSGTNYFLVHCIREDFEGKHGYSIIYDSEMNKICETEGDCEFLGGTRFELKRDNKTYSLCRFNPSDGIIEELGQFENSLIGKYETGNEENSYIILQEKGEKYFVDYNGNLTHIGEAVRRGDVSPRFMHYGHTSEGLTNDGHCLFYDNTLKPVVDISEYLHDEISADMPIFRNGYLGLTVKSKNDKDYHVIYQSDGTKVFEPRKGRIYNYILDGKYMAYDPSEDMTTCYDLEGNICWQVTGRLISVSKNTICIDNSEIDSVCMYDWDGNLLYDTIWYYEK